jgi:hypothetical protein
MPDASEIDASEIREDLAELEPGQRSNEFIRFRPRSNEFIRSFAPST